MDDAAARTRGRVTANGIELAYETLGDAAAPPVVLIMGLAMQMIAWPDELCEGLARRGFFVVRFDNRDAGESTHLRNLPPPRFADLVARRRPPPYSIGDMADDVAGLIEGLGLGAAHLVGASLGGFIAQAVALRHAARVRTLTLMMTSTGSRRVGRPEPRVYARLLRRRAAGDRVAAASAAVATFRLIGSPGFAFDEEHLRDLAGRSWDRGYDPAGYRRQLAAGMSQPDRTAELRRITVPALVMHGRRTRWSRRAGAWRSPRRSRTPASWDSPAWAMTCPGRCGQNSSGRSRRWPHGANSAGVTDRQRDNREVPGKQAAARSVPGAGSMFLVAGKPNRRPVVAAMKVFAACDRGRVTDGASRVLVIDDLLAAIGPACWRQSAGQASAGHPRRAAPG
jgi:pimeloyl-ACP methyl ester carboxylesterase